jgi:hypothetical protein
MTLGSTASPYSRVQQSTSAGAAAREQQQQLEGSSSPPSSCCPPAAGSCRHFVDKRGAAARPPAAALQLQEAVLQSEPLALISALVSAYTCVTQGPSILSRSRKMGSLSPSLLRNSTTSSFNQGQTRPSDAAPL